MKHYKWIQWGAVTGAIVLLTSGCSILGSGQKTQIDPPPAGYGEAATAGVQTIDAGTTGAAGPADSKNLQQTTLYFKDGNGYVAPVTMGLPKNASAAKQALQYLAEDGPEKNMLPKGFTALLPKGTQVKGLDVKDKLATVDFSKEFLNYNAQDERKILEAITWTLTGFPNIQQVQLRVEGKALKEMPEGATPLDEPLSRAMGINLEKAEGVEYGQSTPVTLYFVNQSNPNYEYYVPVTRLVKRTDNVAKAVIEQLIKGPGEGESKGLTAVITPTTELKEDVKVENGLATVNFSDKLLGPDKKAPSEALQTVVLSITENTGASKVQIEVNGDAKITSTDSQNYSKPVTRPVYVNPVKM
jgi:germination protein M